MIYLYDRMRHLVCVPYSITNLHAMADDLQIGRHWFHSGTMPHYDIPKRDVLRIQRLATLVDPREIVRVILGISVIYPRVDIAEDTA